MINPKIQRRINFLIEAAKYDDVRDQAVTFTMRVLSNYATVGKDVGSSGVKGLNKSISNGAEKILLLEHSNLKLFCSQTTNEHPKPLKEIWNFLKHNKDNLDTDMVWNEFTNHKMITVTKEEDRLIRLKGFNSKGTIKERYFDLGIKVKLLEESPVEFFKKRKIR